MEDCDTIKDDMEVETKVKVYKPLMSLLNKSKSAEGENDMIAIN